MLNPIYRASEPDSPADSPVYKAYVREIVLQLPPDIKQAISSDENPDEENEAVKCCLKFLCASFLRALPELMVLSSSSVVVNPQVISVR